MALLRQLMLTLARLPLGVQGLAGSSEQIRRNRERSRRPEAKARQRQLRSVSQMMQDNLREIGRNQHAR